MASGVNAPLIVAGLLALMATAIHGLGGEVFVVRRLSTALLPATRFGGPPTTKTMIHVTWHIATVAFLTVACTLLLSGSVLDGDAAQALSLVAAGASTGFAALALGVGAAAQGGVRRALGSLGHHPGPMALTAIAALAWWGAV